MFVFAGELAAIGFSGRMWRAIRVTFHSDRRYGNHKTFGKPFLQFVVLWLARRHADPPAIVVNHKWQRDPGC